MYSCSLEDDEVTQTNTLEETQATGDDDWNISDGSKD